MSAPIVLIACAIVFAALVFVAFQLNKYFETMDREDDEKEREWRRENGF